MCSAVVLHSFIHSSTEDLVTNCYVPGLIPSTGAATENTTGTVSPLKELRGSRGTWMSKEAIAGQSWNEGRSQRAAVGTNDTLHPSQA